MPGSVLHTFTYIILYSSYNNSKGRMVLSLLFPFYRGGNWGFEKLSNLPMITKAVNSWADGPLSMLSLTAMLQYLQQHMSFNLVNLTEKAHLFFVHKTSTTYPAFRLEIFSSSP